MAPLPLVVCAPCAAKSTEIATLKKNLADAAATLALTITAKDKEIAKLQATATATDAEIVLKDKQIAAHVARSAAVAVYEPLDPRVSARPRPVNRRHVGRLEGCLPLPGLSGDVATAAGALSVATGPHVHYFLWRMARPKRHPPARRCAPHND